MKQPFGLIALDMDGTLLREDKSVHPDTAADIAAAAAAGIEVVYCTGRSPVELLPYVKELPFMHYAVTLSGAYVCDLRRSDVMSRDQKDLSLERGRFQAPGGSQKQTEITEKNKGDGTDRDSACPEEDGCIFERLIPQELVLRLVEEADRHEAMIHFLMADRSVVRGDLIPRMEEFHMAVYQPLYEKVATGVSDMTAEALRHSGVQKVNLYFQSPEDRRMAFDALSDLPLTFAMTEETMLEVSGEGVSKVDGLRALTEYLDIPMDRVMAVGDSVNDLTVLKAAGFSVAMKNAEKSVIALCDAVTEDNENNGVGKAIRKYCLADPAGTGAEAVPGTDGGTEPGPDWGTEHGPDKGADPGPAEIFDPEPAEGADPGPAEISDPDVSCNAAADPEGCCGVLLRGGRSRRMGTDKASLPWGKGTFLQAIAARLDMYSEKYLSVAADKTDQTEKTGKTDQTDRVDTTDKAEKDTASDVVNCAEGSGNTDSGIVNDTESCHLSAVSVGNGIAPDWVVLPDRVPDCGPAGGICTALSVCSAEWAMVVSCDIPGVEESLFRVLMAHRIADAQVVYPVTSDGRMHLTCALYRKSVLPVLEQNIAARDYRLRSLVDRCRSIEVRLDPARDSFLENMLVNINTREDLESAKTAFEQMERKGCGGLSGEDPGKLPLTGCRDFYLEDDGIRIHCKLDYPDRAGSRGPAGSGRDTFISRSTADAGSMSGRYSVNTAGGRDPADKTDGNCDSGTGKIPLLIIFHGFTGHMEEVHIRAVAETANEAGYAALRAELYGHGRSGGDFRDHTLLKWISNALAVIDYARKLPFVSEILLCGHSQGGLLTMLAGAMEQEHLRAILPLSPAWMIPETIRRGEILGTAFDPERIPEKVAAGKGLSLGSRYLRAAQLIEVEPSIRRFRKPVLLVHGSADLAVPVDYSVRAAEMYADARLVIIPEDTHCYDFHLDQVVEAVRAFLIRLRRPDRILR